MKNLKKILALVLVVSALCVGLAVSALAEGEYTGTVEGLNAKVAAVGSAADGDALDYALEQVAAYLKATPVDPAAEGYADAMATVHAKAFDRVQSLLALVAKDEVESTARNQIALNNLTRIVKLGLCDAESAEYVAFYADYEARAALQAEAKEVARQAMLDKTPLSDYDLATFMNASFEAAGNPFSFNGNVNGGNSVDIKDGRLTINYRNNSSNINTYVQYGFPGGGSGSAHGIVVDFDFTTFGAIPTNGFYIEGGGHSGYGTPNTNISEQLNGYPKIYPFYMKITANGDLQSGGDDKNRKTFLTDAVTKGEWIHITAIYNINTYMFELYCEYEFLGEVDAKMYNLTYDLAATRFASATGVESQWSVDNVQIYQGVTLRDLGLFDRLSKPEQFCFYADYYMNDASSDTAGRYVAYKYITGNKANYEDSNGNFINFEKPSDMSEEAYAVLVEDVKAALSALSGYDESQFIAKLRVANRDTYIGMVNELVAITPELSTANINKRADQISRIEAFLLSIEGNIDENDEYDAAVKLYQEKNKSCFVDENALKFNRQMARYELVDTLTALQKYYNKASEYLNDPEYPVDPELASVAGYEEFAKYYAIYLSAYDRIESLKKNENSKKIISCYQIINRFEEDVWIENFDYINTYVVMARATIAEGYYNPDYENIDEIMEKFKPIDDYFYALLQVVHIEELTARLEYVYNNDAYIEKMGTLSYIKRYLENNDIDYDNEQIAKLVVDYNTALEELAFREQDYETVLKQNAYYFVSLVEKMRISEGFNEKKELYDSAIGFYFALDANVEGAREAIAVFDEHTDWFETIDISSRRFLESVAVLQTATTDDEKYAALVDCYVYSLDAEPTYDGVAEALEIFNTEYEAYNNSVETVNVIVENVCVAVGSVRVNCGLSSVIAVIIKKIFG